MTVGFFFALTPMLVVLSIGATLIFFAQPAAPVFAVFAQVVALFLGIPQWVRIIRRKSAADISLTSNLMLLFMIVCVGAQSVVSVAHWLVQLSFLCSGVTTVITLVLTAWYQTKNIYESHNVVEASPSSMEVS